MSVNSTIAILMVDNNTQPVTRFPTCPNDHTSPTGLYWCSYWLATSIPVWKSLPLPVSGFIRHPNGLVTIPDIGLIKPLEFALLLSFVDESIRCISALTSRCCCSIMANCEAYLFCSFLSWAYKDSLSSYLLCKVASCVWSDSIVCATSFFASAIPFAWPEVWPHCLHMIPTYHSGLWALSPRHRLPVLDLLKK